MKRTICAILAGLCLPAAAAAADIPVKAPRLVQAYPSDRGCYGGLGTYGEATKLNVAPPTGVTTSTFAAGGNLSAGAGCLWTFGVNQKIALEGWVNIANTGANQGGVSISNKLSGTQQLLYFGDPSTFARWLPNFSLVDIFPGANALPTNVAPCPVGQTCNPLTIPYAGLTISEAKNEIVMGALNDKAVRVTYGVVGGFQTPMADGSVVRTWASATSSSGAHLSAGVNNGIIAHEGVTYKAGMTVAWGFSKF